MKTITRYFDGSFVATVNMPFKQLWYYIKGNMPKSARWVVDTGKTKRMYFWFAGNEYRADSLCYTQLLT